VLPSDPVLTQKREPRVAERRARFRRIVTATVAACAGVCLIALVITLVSGGDGSAMSAASSAAAEGKTAPTSAEVPVDKLGGVVRRKVSGDAHAIRSAAAGYWRATTKRR